jgi:CheY-like chemotaxis protein
MLVALLQLWGHEVQIAHDGRAALEVAERSTPEVVLLDIGLPILNGFEVARRLKANPRTADAMLVALTGYGQEADRARAREAGFSHHLVKPVSAEMLKDALLSLGPPAAGN